MHILSTVFNSIPCDLRQTWAKIQQTALPGHQNWDMGHQTGKHHKATELVMLHGNGSKPCTSGLKPPKMFIQPKSGMPSVFFPYPSLKETIHVSDSGIRQKHETYL